MRRKKIRISMSSIPDNLMGEIFAAGIEKLFRRAMKKAKPIKRARRSQRGKS